MARDSPVEDIQTHLNEVGVYPKIEWLAECVGHLSNSDLSFSPLPASAQAKLCFAQYIHSDMNGSGAAILPENVANMHKQQIRGRYVLQVDEITDIGVPAKDRYAQTGGGGGGAGRCLKLSITDGAQRVTALEYRRTPAIHATLPAGTKVALTDVPTRRGLLLLSPELVEVLGGQVAELEAARVRAVTKCNEPPRGKRRGGRGEAAGEGSAVRGLGRDTGGPTVAEQATAAAWPQRNPENLETRTEPGGVQGRTAPGGNGSSARPSANGRPTGGESVVPGGGVRVQGDGFRNQSSFSSAAGDGASRAAPPVQAQREQNVGEGMGPPNRAAARGWGMGTGWWMEEDDVDDIEGEELARQQEQRGRRNVESFYTEENRNKRGEGEGRERGKVRMGGVEGSVSEVSGLTGSGAGEEGSERGWVRMGMDGDEQAVDMEEGSDDDVEIIGSTPAPASHRQQEIPTEACRFLYLSRLVGGGGFRGSQKIRCVVSGVKHTDIKQLQLVVYLEDGSQICEARIVPHLIGRLLGAPPGMSSTDLAKALADPNGRIRFDPALSGLQNFLSAFEGVADVRWGREDGMLEVTNLVMGAEEGGSVLVTRARDLLESLEGRLDL